MRQFTIEITNSDGEKFYTKTLPSFDEAIRKASTIQSWSPEISTKIKPLELKIKERQ